jgi:hypothetical protein
MPEKRQKIGDKPTTNKKYQITSKNTKFAQIRLRKTPSGNAGWREENNYWQQIPYTDCIAHSSTVSERPDCS